ncbi:MAG TPA: MFS transporter [Candidatus Acidoferrales bacterium]|jgi:MFS family permease|nr:MFS transporter [Candidatus Acidoferrales bacterium]
MPEVDQIGAAEAAAGTSRVAVTLRALRHRNFQLFFSGQLISLIGTWMQTVAQSWLVYRLTGSSLLLGTVGFASQVPIFLLAPAGGVVADRYNRRRVVIATQAASMILALILAVLTLSKRVTVWEIVILAASLGVVNAFDIPTRQAFLMDMVGREDLMNAIALNSSMFNGARIIGPAVAGILVASIGEGWCFFLNGVSYVAVIAGLLLMKLKRAVAAPASDASHLEYIAEGFRFVRRTNPIWALLLLIALVSLVASPYSVLMPIFADRILHGGARGLGILMGATGVGALLGALTLAMRTGLRGLGRWVAISCACFGASLILFSGSRWFWVSVLLLVPVGYSMMLQMSASNTLIQAMSPDRLRGRVMSVYSMMFMGMAPLGALFAGALADRIGAPLTVALGGVGCMCGAAVFRRRLPKLRVEVRQLIIAQGMAGGEPPQEMNVRSVP